MEDAKAETPLLMFTKRDPETGTEHTGKLDIIDGKFDYQGDIPITDAAKMLFDTLANMAGAWWIERAAKKPEQEA